MLGGLGFTEISIVVLVVVVLFGAKRLPEIGSGIGKGIRNFKKSLSDTDTENDKIEDKIEDKNTEE